MARGRRKGKQSWGAVSKSQRYGAWLRTLAEAQYTLRRTNQATAGAMSAMAAARTRSNIKWKQPGTRFNSQAAARFVELYLRGPPSRSANPTETACGGAAGSAGEEDEQEEVDLGAWLRRRRCEEGEEEEEEDNDDEDEDGIPSLTELCCRQIGLDLPLYGAAAAKATAEDNDDDDDSSDSDGDGDDDASETAEAIRGLFGILPTYCLERISLAASGEGLVDDAGLALLAQPSLVRLVAVGSFTDEGLARALYPRLLKVTTSAGAAASWEDDTFEPRLGGCVALESLLLSSAALTPRCLAGLGRHLPTLKALALPHCFNGQVTLTAKEVLGLMGTHLKYVHSLDLRGCAWLSDKGLASWVAKKREPVPSALRRLYVDRRFARQEALRAAFRGYRRGEDGGRGKGIGGGGGGGLSLAEAGEGKAKDAGDEENAGIELLAWDGGAGTSA